MEYMMLLCTLICIQRYIINVNTIAALSVFRHTHIVYQHNRDVSSRRKRRDMIKWSEFIKLLPDAPLRRYLRMDRSCFRKLCHKIENAVGEAIFKSENFLESHCWYYYSKGGIPSDPHRLLFEGGIPSDPHRLLKQPLRKPGNSLRKPG